MANNEIMLERIGNTLSNLDDTICQSGGVEGIDYPTRKNNIKSDLTGLEPVTVKRYFAGEEEWGAQVGYCVDNALDFNGHYGLEVVRGYCGNKINPEDKRSWFLFEHYWNKDEDGVYWDSTPLYMDVEYHYFLEQE